MDSYTKIAYIGTALPTGANVVVLFSSVVSFPMANAFQMIGIHRILVGLQNDQAGTIKGYRSVDRGVTWVRCVADIAVAAAATNDVNDYDFLVEQYDDFKLEWTNGGSNQTVFAPTITAVPTRQVAT